MDARVEKRLVLVLAVEFDKSLRKIPQRAGGRERTVDERAAASLGSDLATDHHLGVAVLEDRLDGGDRLARADEVSRRAAAEEQAHRLDEHGLAGARLAGQDVQPLVELDVRRFDEGKITDAEEREHAGGT